MDENAESWPHLKELVQSISAPYVHVENKYGHFQSTGPMAADAEVFEEPEKEMEPPGTQSFPVVSIPVRLHESNSDEYQYPADSTTCSLGQMQAKSVGAFFTGASKTMTPRRW